MKKLALKYFTAAFVLAFVSASLYCSVEAFAEATIEFVVSHHHHDDGAASHEHAAPACPRGHHHDNGATPKANGQYEDFCCSQLNGIISQWKNATPTAKSFFAAATVTLVEQTSFVTPFATRGWLLHDKAPPFSPHHNLFYVLNFPPHAPPLSLSC